MHDRGGDKSVIISTVLLSMTEKAGSTHAIAVLIKWPPALMLTCDGPKALSDGLSTELALSAEACNALLLARGQSGGYWKQSLSRAGKCHTVLRRLLRRGQNLLVECITPSDLITCIRMEHRVGAAAWA